MLKNDKRGVVPFTGKLQQYRQTDQILAQGHLFAARTCHSRGTELRVLKDENEFATGIPSVLFPGEALDRDFSPLGNLPTGLSREHLLVPGLSI
jgi:hypothetical protein